MSVGPGCEVEFGDAARNTEMVVRYAKRTRSVAPRETASTWRWSGENRADSADSAAAVDETCDCEEGR